MTELETAWLAGWLEGEGTFYIGKNRTAAVVQVFSTDRDVIERAASLTSGRAYYIKPRLHSEGYISQEGWRLHLESELAVAVMKLILPLMGQRRTAKIREVLHAWDERPNRPIAKECACGCGRTVFGGPRRIYARTAATGSTACAQRAYRQRKAA